MDDVYLFGSQQLSESGTYIDTFKTANNCDSIVTLTLEELGEFSDTVRAKILAGTTYEIDRFRFAEAGDHLVTLTSSLGCDSLVLLQLEFFQFFIPNVFSPNQDGINDVFKVYGADGLIDNRDLVIFDRWGAKIYQGAEWDGTYKGKQVNPGVFIYRGRLIMSDGTEQEVSGSVTVVR